MEVGRWETEGWENSAYRERLTQTRAQTHTHTHTRTDTKTHTQTHTHIQTQTHSHIDPPIPKCLVRFHLMKDELRSRGEHGVTIETRER